MKNMNKQVTLALNIIIGVLLCGVAVLTLAWVFQPHQQPETAPPALATATPAHAPVTPAPRQVGEPDPPPVPPMKAEAQTGPVAIDPVRLAEAEAHLARNRIYEQKARSTLPTLSLQTHNPVWALQQEAEQHRRRAEAGKSSQDQPQTVPQGPQPAPESGPFGNIQPPEGEIWLRIPVDNAREFKDIMAQNADLFRVEAQYGKPVTVTLWVGGRVYARQQYQ